MLYRRLFLIGDKKEGDRAIYLDPGYCVSPQDTGKGETCLPHNFGPTNADSISFVVVGGSLETPTFAPPGSISWGTHTFEYLYRRFMGCLIEHHPSVASRIEFEYMETLADIVHDEGGRVVSRDERIQELQSSTLTEDLFNALDEIAPHNHHFGTREGDGADFGFWLNSEVECAVCDSLGSPDDMFEREGHEYICATEQCRGEYERLYVLNGSPAC